MSREIRVMRAPVRVYSQKVSLTSRRRADSATIRLATEPSSVRLPARVEAEARVSQPAVGLGRLAVSGRSNRTAGTLETRLLSRTVMAEKLKTLTCSFRCVSSSRRLVSPLTSREPVTIKRAAKKTNRLQSNSAKTDSGWMRRVKSSAQAARKAAKATGAPSKKASSRPPMMIRHLVRCQG